MVAAEARLDRKYLLSTSEEYVSPSEVALGYKNLLTAEGGFRDLKSGLLLRPVFQGLEPRIRGVYVDRSAGWRCCLPEAPRMSPAKCGTPSAPNCPRSPRSPIQAREAPWCRPPNSPTSNGQYS